MGSLVVTGKGCEDKRMTMTMSKEQLEPFRLGVRFAERVWGSLDLQPWYSYTATKPVGEVWLTGEICVVETGPHAGKLMTQMESEFREPLLGGGYERFPLLVKILFPSEKLSVQVHPDDAQAEVLGGDARAKTECWYVLEAKLGASLSLGLEPGTTHDAVRDALGTATLEKLLRNQPVEAGDMIYVEAGTVHAIGGGLVILEVQQPSDTTFRLYDYGRARDLHLKDGMKVIKIETASRKVAPQKEERCTKLIDVKHFAMSRCDVGVGESYGVRGRHTPECIVGLRGSGVVVHAETRIDVAVGQAIVIPACCEEYSVEGECSFVRCRVPEYAA